VDSILMKGSLRVWVGPVVACLLVCSLLLPAAVAPAAAQDDAEPSGLAATMQEFEADRVDFDITVYENGSATWVFRYRRGLDTEQERQDFEAYAEEFNENETELYRTFRWGARNLTAEGSETTGREMSAENFLREARIEGPADNLGVVAMSFRWDGFARADGRVVMGDVFEGGLYIGPDQRLVVRPGPGLAFDDVSPDGGEFDEDSRAESRSVTWVGEKSFNPGRPRVEFVDEADAGTDTPAEGNPGWLLPAGAAIVVLLLGLAGAIAYRSSALPWDDDDGGVTGDGGAGAGAAASGGDGGGGGAAVTEEELISDEERVVNLLEDHEGRMKQVNIVDETGWSKSKVSMLLSDMEEEGTISKLRVGRENIVSLAGHEPDAAGSPFEKDGEE
jgi:hypothetical protein